MEPGISPETATVLHFMAFGALWIFPIALVIAVLGFANADANSQPEDPGPNVVPFPTPAPEPGSQKINPLQRLKRLAFPVRNR